jgi:hypothetical protein
MSLVIRKGMSKKIKMGVLSHLLLSNFGLMGESPSDLDIHASSADGTMLGSYCAEIFTHIVNYRKNMT